MFSTDSIYLEVGKKFDYNFLINLFNYESNEMNFFFKESNLIASYKWEKSNSNANIT
jgi:hypothetical protein